MDSKNLFITRMHSTRMHTIHCSGRLSCHTCPPPTMHAPTMHAPCHACPPAMHAPLPCMSPATHIPLCHAFPPSPCMSPLTTHAPPPVNRQTFVKTLPLATTVPDGKKQYCMGQQSPYLNCPHSCYDNV